MKGVSGFIAKQGQLGLENRRYAVIQALILALLPYTTWLSSALIALVTLRKGEKAGRSILIPTMMAHFLVSLVTVSLVVGSINTLLTFVPCFLAASFLRESSSWRAVAGCFFVIVTVIMICLQFLAPEYIMAQYAFIKSMLNDLPNESMLLSYLSEKGGVTPELFANYLIGVQAAGISLSSVFALMLARSVQSQLFYPGAFKQEMLSFRADKFGLVLLVVTFFMAKQGQVVAINILPMLLLYFTLAGISLGFSMLGRKKGLSSFLLLIAPLLFLPFVVLPIYVILGTLDCLFNFRIYLPTRADKRT